MVWEGRCTLSRRQSKPKFFTIGTEPACQAK
jgi:hypothetical protein